MNILWFNKKRIKSSNICFYALGTINYIAIFDDKSSPLLDAAMNIVYDIDNKMSVYKEDSEISLINKMAGKQAVKVSKETFFVLEKATYYSYLLKGTFDVTIRPLVKLWQEHCEKSIIPLKDKIDEKLKLVDYNSIYLNNNNRTVFLKNQYQEIDLGSIAKGYAADLVKDFLIQNRVKNALINLGGNVVVIGRGNKGDTVNVGIQDPDAEKGISMGAIKIRDKSVVTSAGYERYYFIGNKKYHHIIDPFTGYPSASGIKSATVISGSSCEADALATGLFMSGLKETASLLKNYPKIDVILITDDNKVYLTENIMSKFILLNEKYSCLQLFS